MVEVRHCLSLQLTDIRQNASPAITDHLARKACRARSLSEHTNGRPWDHSDEITKTEGGLDGGRKRLNLGTQTPPRQPPEIIAADSEDIQLISQNGS